MELTDLDIGEEDGSDGFVNFGDKKRRLTFEQVKTLEKSFELGNKLDFDRKIQLAKALGLQPRQVAIWFQNKRARRKTKQLQKDFDALKKDYDALKGKYDILLEENIQFNDEVQRLSSTEPGNNERNGKVWVSEIETQQNSTNSTLEPTNSPTELSSEAEICKTCTEPVRDTYPMTWKEQGSGCSTITNEAESYVFSESPFKIESPQLQGVSLTLANNNSSPLLPEISSVGEQASGALKMAPQSHETRCLTTMQEVSVWLNQDEQTCSNLFHSLEDQSALMLWEYWHIRSE